MIQSSMMSALPKVKPLGAGVQPLGAPKPQVSPASGVAPVGAPQPQVAPPMSLAKRVSGHILTTRDSGNPASPWQAPVSGVSPVGPPAPQASSAPPGAPFASFGPGHDLLSTQINPNTGGPNRTELAQKSIADWDAQHAPQFAADQRAVGQNAAKFGRIGAGMTTNDLTGLEATHNRDRMSFQNALASGLASDTINDARSNNNELRTERDYQTGRSDKAQQDAINQRNNEEDLLNSQFGRSMKQAEFGYGGSPVDTLGKFSGALGDSAAASTGAGINLITGANKPQPGIDFSSLFPKPQAPQVPGTASPAQQPYWLGQL